MVLKGDASKDLISSRLIIINLRALILWFSKFICEKFLVQLVFNAIL